METIYTHNVTPEELKAIGCDCFTREKYESFFSEDAYWYDLAMLFRFRQDKSNEDRAWSHIPEMRDEFLRGLDDILLDE